MKKILVFLAVLAATQLANAQKSAADYAKDIESKATACANPKKAAKPATWIALAKANIAAYNAPKGDAQIGFSKQNIALLMMDVKPLSSAQKTIGGQPFTVDSYESCDFYYNASDQLALMIVTKPYVPDALDAALKAYSKAAEVDPTGSKTKEISDGIAAVAGYYKADAGDAYHIGDLAASSVLFEKSADASATAPYATIDKECLYNAGLTAFLVKDYARSKDLFSRCLDAGNASNGDTYARLAESLNALGDKPGAKEILEKGFAEYPSNQSIIVGLINTYLDNNDDPQKLFDLLDKAKANEPNNASLYYVEGNIRKQLGQKEEALASYAKCSEINPEYEYGFIGEAQLYAEEADSIRDAAEKEFNDKKYQVLVEQFEEKLLKVISAYEKAFNTSKSPELKRSLADCLKNSYYRIRTKDQKYQDAYDKYSDFMKNGGQ